MARTNEKKERDRQAELAASRALPQSERRRLAGDALTRAKQLRTEVREDLSRQRWGADDLQMERYNILATMANWLYVDNPAVYGLIELPDAMIQSYGTFYPIERMPPDLPARRIEGRLTVLIERLEMALGDAAETSAGSATKDGRSGFVQARPRVFISHSGESVALHRLLRFVWDLEVEPVVAEWLPFKGQLVPHHVVGTMESCVAAIVFATGADRVGDRQHPGRGVLIETGILQERFNQRVIYLVERGTEFGPMGENFACEFFTQDNLERAFHRLVLELKAYGLILR